MLSKACFLVVAPLALIAACTVSTPTAPTAPTAPRDEQTATSTGAVERAAIRLPRGAARPRNPDGSVIGAPSVFAPQSGAPVQKLLYFGGKVISNVKVLAVNWGPNVNATLKNGIGAFYTAITDSVYFDWLSEYETIGVRGVDGSFGTNQRIGRGSFGGSSTITPFNTATTIDDDDIARELAAQIAAGNLPQPETDASGNVNSLYMFDFPRGITINLYSAGAIAKSCVGYGAYHSTTRIAGKAVPYGVHPDCNYSFNTATSIHSHELIEAVTDTEVGLVDPDLVVGVTRPSAWYGFVNGADDGEIGDICESGASSTVVAGYTVQKQWSNSQGACIGISPTVICDGATTPIAGCRACTAADDGVACNGARSHCETDPANAKHGQCVVCTASAHCPAASPVCKKSGDETDDTCVTTSGCTTNAECSGTTPVCDAGLHQCRACVDADCSGAAPACETTGTNIGRCVQCTTSKLSACSVATPVCDPFTNVCVACQSSSDCGATTPVCAVPAHACRACQKDLECAGSAKGHACLAQGALAGSCAVCSSANKTACPAGARGCDDNTGTCVECAIDTDCADPVKAFCDVATHTCHAMPDGGVDSGVDAGTDAGAVVDSGAATDSGAGVDSGNVLADAGHASDSGATQPPDAASPEAGVDAPHDDSAGCALATRSSAPAGAAFTGLLLGLAALARRRRHS